jgi:MFS family permease
VTAASRRLLPGLLFATAFRRFWLGQTISVFGDQISLLALPIVAVLVLHADAGQMGLLTAVGLLPHLLFSLPAGAWLDRVRQRRRLMIAADIARGLLIATVPAASLAGVLRLEQLFVVAFVAEALAVVFDISWATLFVAVTPREDYVSANSLLNGSRSLSQVGGPAIGGVLIQAFGAPLAMLADAASFFGSAFFLGRIQATEPPVEPQVGALREQITSGLLFILRDSILRPTVMSVATLNFFNLAFQALFILYATRDLGVEPGILGVALGTGAVGGVIGALSAARIGRAIGLGPAFAVGLVLFPAALLLVPLAGGPLPLILGFLFAAEFGSGLGVMILDVNAGAILLARIPDRIRGRGMGGFRFINYGIRPIGALLGGILGGLLGVHETLFVVTIASLAGVLWLIGSPLLQVRDVPEAAA